MVVNYILSGFILDLYSLFLPFNQNVQILHAIISEFNTQYIMSPSFKSLGKLRKGLIMSTEDMSSFSLSFFFLYPFSHFFVLHLLVLQRLLCNSLCFTSVGSNGECTQLKRVLELYHSSSMFPFSSLEPTLETREPSQVF